MTDLLILFAVAMAVSAVGWKYFVYFFSLGYGYGIAALAVAMGVMYHANLTVPTIAMLVLLFIFGVRLGTYLLVRERKAVGYRKILYGEDMAVLRAAVRGAGEPCGFPAGERTAR